MLAVVFVAAMARFGDRQGDIMPLADATRTTMKVKKQVEEFTFITLENVPERVQHVQHERQRISYPTRIWPAVDTSMLHQPQYKRFLRSDTFQTVRRGAIGCAMSHLSLLEHLVASGTDSMVILEDDAVFADNFEVLYKEFRAQLPMDAEFCQLLHHTSMTGQRAAAVNVSSAVIRSYAPYGTVAYWVSAGGARKLLKSGVPIYSPIDEMYRDAIGKGRVVSYMPRKDLVHMPYKAKSNIWSTKIRKQNPECAPFHNIWTPALKQAMHDLLAFTLGVFEELHIEAAICAGSLLGYARHDGGYIPWDDDVDLCLRNAGDEAAIIRRVNADPVYCTASFWGGPKVFRCDSPLVSHYKWRYPLVDIFSKGLLNEYAWPSAPATWNGLNVRVMRDTQGYLRAQYGNGVMSTCISLAYSHASESALKPHTMPCDEWRKKCS